MKLQIHNHESIIMDMVIIQVKARLLWTILRVFTDKAYHVGSWKWNDRVDMARSVFHEIP